MGLRFTVSRAHGVTPYKLLFGREPLLPSSVKVREFNLEAALEVVDEVAASEYVEDLVAYSAEFHQVIGEPLYLYASRSNKYFDQMHKEQESFEFSKG